jgi:hypothetical protein
MAANKGTGQHHRRAAAPRRRRRPRPAGRHPPAPVDRSMGGRADRGRVRPTARDRRAVSAGRQAEGKWRETRPHRRARPAPRRPRFRTSAGCGRDRIRTCEGNAGDFTGRSGGSSRVPLHPHLVPPIACDVDKRHSASPPVSPCPARPSVGRREGGGKSWPSSDQRSARMGP